MPYFRADAHLIAQMIKKDCLRYNTENLASLETLFALPTKTGKCFYLAVILFGEIAEKINRIASENLWFEVKGQLSDHSPKFESFQVANLSIIADSFVQVPAASSSIVQCDLIGRLTREPEHIIKNDSYDFVRFSVAVNRKNHNNANYFDVSVFKPKIIELINENVSKGQSIFASGELAFFQKANDPLIHCSVKLEQLLLLEKHL